MSVCTTGGQGCVFYPELECNDEKLNHESRKQYISKLQTISNTNFEYSIINYLKRTIPKYVPEYNKYTILDDITMCIPKQTQREIQTKCPKCIIPYNNNTDVSILNIPYKGLPLNRVLLSANLVPDLWKAKHYTNVSKLYAKAVKYYQDSGVSTDKMEEALASPDYFKYITIEYSFKTLNNRLIALYKNVIQVINNIGIYHSDIKASNILINLSSTPTKYQFHHTHVYLIDWGVTNLSTNSVINMNRQLCIPILSPSFMGYYNTYSTAYTAEAIVLTYFTNNPISITGHVSIINESLNILTGIHVGYKCGIHPSWFNHLVKWVNYIKQSHSTFDDIKSIVTHNKDIAGIVSVYVTMYSSLYYNYILPTMTKYPEKIQVESKYEAIYKFYKRLGIMCVQHMVDTFTKINPDLFIDTLTDLNKYLV